MSWKRGKQELDKSQNLKLKNQILRLIIKENKYFCKLNQY